MKTPIVTIKYSQTHTHRLICIHRYIHKTGTYYLHMHTPEAKKEYEHTDSQRQAYILRHRERETHRNVYKHTHMLTNSWMNMHKETYTDINSHAGRH